MESNILDPVLENFNLQMMSKHKVDWFKLMVHVIEYIFTQIRSKKKETTKNILGIFLTLLYLKVSLVSPSWLSVLENPKTNLLMMNLLGSSQGLKKIIRYFEDAPKAVLIDEYQKTLKWLPKK